LEVNNKKICLSNKEASAEQMGGYPWGHWSIEKELHWILDVVFGEDGDRKRKDHAPENLNVLRKGGYSAPETAGAGEKDQLQAPDVHGVHEGRLQILPSLGELNEFALVSG
jgi:hypothetical protein